MGEGLEEETDVQVTSVLVHWNTSMEMITEQVNTKVWMTLFT